MPRTTTGAEHLDAMQDYLNEAADARKNDDVPRLHAAAAAAQAHLSAAEFLWRISQSATSLDRRTWGRWADAAGRS